MKKIVSAFAALAAAVCFGESAGIASNNIVGYNNIELGENMNMMIADFVPVNGEGIDIQTLLPKVPSGKLESYDFIIQFYGATGIKEQSYYYMLADDTVEEKYDGWYDDNEGAKYSTKKIGKGEGFVLYALRGGTVVFSGQVEGAEFDLVCRSGLSHQGNIRPTNVGIQSLIPEVPAGQVLPLASYDFVIQYYDGTGIKVQSYYYMLADDTVEEKYDGWYDDNEGANLSEKVFTPAEGFYVNTPTGGTITLPALSL